MSNNETKKQVEALQQITKLLCDVSSVTLISHVQPDSDAFGSMLGLAIGLEQLGKRVVCVDETPTEDRYMFMPTIERVVHSLPNSASDLTIALDCGDLKRVGDKLSSEVGTLNPLINIDHHISNDYFGSVNLVDPTASSTSEIIFTIIRELEEKRSKKLLTPECAYALLTGIVGDTGGFRYRSASSYTLAVAGELIVAGANLSEICDALFASQSLPGVRLRGLALSGLRLELENKVAFAIIDEKEYVQCSATPADTEGIAEELRSIQGVEVGVLIRRDGDIWRVSLRGKSPEHDLSQVAQRFGGGGHRAAAAFRYRRDLPCLVDGLLSELRTLLLG